MKYSKRITIPIYFPYIKRVQFVSVKEDVSRTLLKDVPLVFLVARAKMVDGH